MKISYIILGIVILSCTQLFAPPLSVLASDCGDSMINGLYSYQDEFNGRPRYQRLASSPDPLIYCTIFYTGTRWELDVDGLSGGNPVHADYYFNNSSTPLPPATGWQQDTSGPLPVPTLSGDVSLSVELSHFTALATPDGIKLTWQTESETDNLGFIIEKSTSNVMWNTFASFETNDQLMGQGTKQTRTTYSFTDHTVDNNKNVQYRLLDVTCAGKITTLETIQFTPSNIPKATKLYPAYPNPFNPQTRISYDVGEECFVEINIYDSLGQLVKTLASGNQPAGQHSVFWNGTNNNNKKLSSGLYFIILQNRLETLSQKILLLK